MESATWTDEGIWNATVGAYETTATALAEAKRQSITPQVYLMSCVEEALTQGADFDADEAYESLCRQCGVSCQS